jgi:hypothetical protein
MSTRSTCLAVAGLLWAAAIPLGAAGPVALQPVTAFSTIADPQARSLALFAEASKVITSPRCLNCHPATREVTQGDDLHAHMPLMNGGRLGAGVAGLPCRSCHGAANTPTLAGSIASIPGSPGWVLAPASMAWQGKSLREICLQIQDPARNGNRTLTKISEHMAKDSVVGWGFAPGDGRTPAPGTQAQFAALIDAWIATGARCPQP